MSATWPALSILSPPSISSLYVIPPLFHSSHLPPSDPSLLPLSLLPLSLFSPPSFPIFAPLVAPLFSPYLFSPPLPLPLSLLLSSLLTLSLLLSSLLPLSLSSFYPISPLPIAPPLYSPSPPFPFPWPPNHTLLYFIQCMFYLSSTSIYLISTMIFITRFPQSHTDVPPLSHVPFGLYSPFHCVCW